jgi:mitogen-activated protein kinase kinase kinase
MYNFFGHRPPSELISSHLAEYFPSAKKRELEKTVRHSMLRRASIAPSIADSRRSIEAPAKPSPPRKSVRPGSRGTIASPPTAAIPEESEAPAESLPRVSVSNDDGQVMRPSIDGESEDGSIASIESKPPLLPPLEPSGESFADSLQAFGPAPRARPKSIASRRGSVGSTQSRISMLSHLRRNRDRSDTASLLTVDEITAEVEQRRASTITFEESDEEPGEISVGVIRAADPGLPQSESEDEEEVDSEDDDDDDDDDDVDDEDDEDEDEEDEEDEDEHGKAFTSTGCERPFFEKLYGQTG